MQENLKQSGIMIIFAFKCRRYREQSSISSVRASTYTVPDNSAVLDRTVRDPVRVCNLYQRQSAIRERFSNRYEDDDMVQAETGKG